MEKITLQNITKASLNRTMRDLFQDLIDITMEDNPKGCLKSIPTNYGYIFFWYGWLNKKALQKHFTDYVTKERVKEIKQNKKENSALSLQDQLGDFLFSMVRDHPDLIGSGHAETHLSILAPSLKQASLSEATKGLKEYAQKLERLEKFSKKYLRKNSIVEEIETNFEAIDYITAKDAEKFGDEYFWDDECGYIELARKKLACEIQVRIHFDAEDKLSQV
ncbi:MAG: hypothetical protein GX638_18210, partial [Crenarchaeota archaeon]|nr:hypothetical protein [Thermoproteota archaeon]